MSAVNDALNSGHYRAWVDANDPETAIQTWPRITLQANSTSYRPSRASQINALKRAIEFLFAVRLILESKSYSEAHGFMNASYFTYRIEREV